MDEKAWKARLIQELKEMDKMALLLSQGATTLNIGALIFILLMILWLSTLAKAFYQDNQLRIQQLQEHFKNEGM